MHLVTSSRAKAVTGLAQERLVLVQSRDWIILFLNPGLLLTAVLLGLAGWRLRQQATETGSKRFSRLRKLPAFEEHFAQAILAQAIVGIPAQSFPKLLLRCVPTPPMRLEKTADHGNIPTAGLQTLRGPHGFLRLGVAIPQHQAPRQIELGPGKIRMQFDPP
jgi:hypothetical protein